MIWPSLTFLFYRLPRAVGIISFCTCVGTRLTNKAGTMQESEIEDYLSEASHNLSDMLTLELWDSDPLTTPSGDAAPSHPSSTGCCPSSNNICITRISQILNKLHVRADVCLSRSHDISMLLDSGRQRGMDTILAGSTEAARVVSDSLQCPTCCNLEQLHLLAAVVLQKLVDWYWALTRSIREVSDQPERSEQVLHQSIHIGDYHIENNAQVPIIAFIVSQQSRQLETLVDALSEVMGGTGRGCAESLGAYGGGQSSPLEMPRERLVCHLKGSLQAIRDELAISIAS